jgi:hypothetical protein
MFLKQTFADWIKEVCDAISTMIYKIQPQHQAVSFDA